VEFVLIINSKREQTVINFTAYRNGSHLKSMTITLAANPDGYLDEDFSLYDTSIDYLNTKSIFYLNNTDISLSKLEIKFVDRFTNVLSSGNGVIYEDEDFTVENATGKTLEVTNRNESTQDKNITVELYYYSDNGKILINTATLTLSANQSGNEPSNPSDPSDPSNISSVLFGGKDLTNALSLKLNNKSVASIKLGGVVIWPLVNTNYVASFYKIETYGASSSYNETTKTLSLIYGESTIKIYFSGNLPEYNSINSISDFCTITASPSNLLNHIEFIPEETNCYNILNYNTTIDDISGTLYFNFNHPDYEPNILSLNIVAKARTLVKISKPTLTRSDIFEYTGSVINIADYYSEEVKNTVDITGRCEGTSPGGYTYYITPKDGYCWEDGSTSPITQSFVIQEPHYNYTLTYVLNDNSADFYWDTNDPNPGTPEISASLVSDFDVWDIGSADIQVNGNYVMAYKSSDAWVEDDYGSGALDTPSGHYNTDPMYNVGIEVRATDPNGGSHAETIYLTAYSTR